MASDTTNTFFTWDAALDTGVAEIDSGHRHFLDLLGLLNDGIAAGWAAPAIGKLLREIESHLRVHFLDEECLLEVSGCPELLRQRGERMGFLEHLAELELSPNPVTGGTAERLRDAMLQHIRAGQEGYAAWMAKAVREGRAPRKSAAA